MSLLSGSPKTVLSVADNSALVRREPAGIICVQGPTKRGRINKVAFIGNSFQFMRVFGGHRSDSLFPTLCMRMLDAGAKLYVNRIGHYTDIEDAGTLDGTKATGTITVEADVLTVQAKEVGDGYNGLVVTVQEAASGDAAKVDITAEIDNASETVRDIPNNLATADVGEWNEKFDLIDLVSITGVIPVGNATLATGAQDIAAIVADDRNGSVTSKIGWYAFSGVTDAWRIANIESQDPVVDAGLATFCQAMSNGGNPFKFHVAAPVGANAAGFEDYRMGTGAYAHTPIDNYLGTLVAGDIKIVDPRDSERKIDIPGLVDVLPLVAAKDNVNPWLSAAGYKRGKVQMPNFGVNFNLGAGDNAADFDRIYEKGVNAVVYQDFNVMYWGNRSMLLDKTKLTSKENVADLLVHIIRGIRPLVKQEQFEPNDPQSWRKIYLNVRPFIQTLVDGRAIRPGENERWFWIGDQDVDDYIDAEFNSVNDLDAGIYKARFIFVPVPAMEYIGIDITATNTNALSFVVNNNP